MILCECLCTCCDTQVFLLPDASGTQTVIRIRCYYCGRELLPRRILSFEERHWLECKDPHLLTQWQDPRISKRKRRLFVCGCCRLIWDSLTDPRSRGAVETAERHADGQATHSDLVRAERQAQAVNKPPAGFWPPDADWVAVAASANQDFSGDIRRLFPRYGRCTPDKVLAARVSDLFRDILGNPFRNVLLLQEWLDWTDRTVVKIAQAIYEERAFDRMPILGDALEEAGCTDPDILDHCRQPGEHARGCWLVDQILGKT